MVLSPFEHKFIRSHQHHLAGFRQFFLAVSGGLDSMVLLHLFQKFKSQMKSQFRVCTVHHGLSVREEISIYRNASLKIVRNYCNLNDIEFLTNEIQQAEEIKSEQQLRNYRYSCFKALKRDSEILVLGHHLDDLLETQLMDLIRGSHFASWSNFTEYHNEVFRPLALVPKENILQYAKEQNLKWVNDPTNQDTETLRNWLRNDFLSPLSKQSKSFKENLMKNLMKLYEFSPILEPGPELSVALAQWLKMTETQKKQFVLKSSQKLGLKSMTQGQILDILKKLDLGQKEIKFQTGPLFWSKTTDRLQVYRENL